MLSEWFGSNKADCLTNLRQEHTLGFQCLLNSPGSCCANKTPFLIRRTCARSGLKTHQAPSVTVSQMVSGWNHSFTGCYPHFWGGFPSGQRTRVSWSNHLRFTMGILWEYQWPGRKHDEIWGHLDTNALIPKPESMVMPAWPNGYPKLHMVTWIFASLGPQKVSLWVLR